MAAPNSISKLIAKYEQGRGQQASLAADCVHKLLKELGWSAPKKTDTDTGARIVRESFLEAITPKNSDAARDKRPPDYSLQVNSERKGFIAMMEPSNDSAFHLRRFTWSANLPISVLSNFEELRIYDGLYRPQHGDSADTALIKRFLYTEYEKRWPDIEKLLSSSALEKDAFEFHAPHALQRLPVDDAFLEEMDGWRWDLARNIDRRNPGISLTALNSAVQHTINCILFLRICEDRGIEPYGTLRQISDQHNVFEKLKTQFRIADTRYNAGIFRINENLVGDTFTIEDDFLRRIIGKLYYPVSPYEFSVINVDMLGQVYERFLGRAITRSDSGAIAVDQKPEVRKSGGVYYTPARVVRALVQSTVGKLCEGKTPEEVAKLRVLDPSCGSGSFLNAAYKYLLDWHHRYYLQNRSASRISIHNTRSGDWQLTLEARKTILINNIFGVDLDAQAVEVAKLSLLLKVLEGVDSSKKQLLMIKDRVLPNPDRNIQCGNSLLGPDFEEHRKDLSLDERDLFQPFDYVKQFPLAFNREPPGFDAVIGNPPYLSYSGRHSIPLPEPIRDYYSVSYKSFQWPCAHALFMERSVSFLSRKYVAFIVPDSVGKLSQNYGRLREVMLANSGLAEVRYWGDSVFKGVTMPTLTFVTDREFEGKTAIIREDHVQSAKSLSGGAVWDFSTHQRLLDRLSTRSFSLEALIKDVGVMTGDKRQEVIPCYQAAGSDILVLEGKDIQRYQCSPHTIAIRPGPKTRIRQSAHIYKNAPFLIRQTANRLIVGPHRHTTYFRNTLHALYAPPDWPDLKDIVAILNSRLIRFVWQELVPEARQRVQPQVKIGVLRALPIRMLDQNILEEKAFHNEVVRNVDEILDLYVALPNHLLAEQERIEQRIALIDDRIDRLIDRLYGLSDQEVTDIKHALGLPDVRDSDLETLETAPDEPDALLNYSSDTLWERLRREPRNQRWRACLHELVDRQDPGLAAFIAARLEEPKLDPETQKSLIFAALGTHSFERDVRAGLRDNLLAHARALRNTGNEETLSAALKRAAAMMPAQNADVLLEFLQDSNHPDTQFTALTCLQNIFLIDFPAASPALKALRTRVHQMCSAGLEQMSRPKGTPSPSTMNAITAKASFCAAASLLDPLLPDLARRFSALHEPYLKRGSLRFLKELETSWNQLHPKAFEASAKSILASAANGLLEKHTVPIRSETAGTQPPPIKNAREDSAS